MRFYENPFQELGSATQMPEDIMGVVQVCGQVSSKQSEPEVSE